MARYMMVHEHPPTFSSRAADRFETCVLLRCRLFLVSGVSDIKGQIRNEGMGARRHLAEKECPAPSMLHAVLLTTFALDGKGSYGQVYDRRIGRLDRFRKIVRLSVSTNVRCERGARLLSLCG